MLLQRRFLWGGGTNFSILSKHKCSACDSWDHISEAVCGHLDQACQTRGLCDPSGSLGPSVKVKNGSKKSTGVFVLVTSLAGRSCSRGEAHHDITATLRCLKWQLNRWSEAHLEDQRKRFCSWCFNKHEAFSLLFVVNFFSLLPPTVQTLGAGWRC